MPLGPCITPWAGGIEASKIFRTKKDREDFIDRLAELCRSGRWSVYAWALMPNHFHLLVRTGKEPLARSMRRLMTGYAINFNLRHKRRGHFFQNRSAERPADGRR